MAFNYQEKINLPIEGYFSKGQNPFQQIKYKKVDIRITDEGGNHLFTQKDAEFPDFFSQKAMDVVGSRYFYGENGTSERENSFGKLIDRTVSTYKTWALKREYFDEEDAVIFEKELAWLTLNQYMSFNSPVWFNVGTHLYPSKIRPDKGGGYAIIDNKSTEIPVGRTHEFPQTSACFIQYVPDTMEGIMQLATNEAMLFKDGSGTGTDLSTLRSSKEKLSGGGKPSGPIAYLIFYDDVAGIVKSGGKTRRAAKMDSLKIWHPDILEFIEIKAIEQGKIRALIKQGYTPQVAIESVHFQNTNLSVRVTDDFMQAVIDDKDWKTKPVHNKNLADKMPVYKARELWKKITKSAWDCGDPGLQYDDTINKWHTCPNSGIINASNPCSEYMFLDDSACNLASLNLMKFRKDNGGFDVEKYQKAIRIMTIAMDLNIDDSSYPTKKIAENAYLFRPLGLGYSNLGTLIMTLGLPYDSDEARTIAAVITALTTAETYKTSSEMAKHVGTFNEYEKNKGPMLKIMGMHRKKLDEINISKLPEEMTEVYEAAKKSWEEVIENGKKYGFRNAQATVLAPTGTISFMMDCDTTGIEPDIALVKWKRLAEGGLMKLVNSSVGVALERLGYSENQIGDIIHYILGNSNIEKAPYLKKEHYQTIKNIKDSKTRTEELKKLDYNNEEIDRINLFLDGYGTIEGAPQIKEEHLPVFDCALRPHRGKRSIQYMGHINMMAAVQPFLSGAISKTVNLSSDCTEEDIANAYMNGWKMGLKAIAVYRDGSKDLQPLTISKTKGAETNINQIIFKPIRKKLPGTRNSVTHKFNIASHEGYLTVGLYEDGKPGELFINMSKEGSTVGGLMDAIGVMTSFALQYGVPLDVLARKMKDNRFEPYGMVFEGGHNIHTAKSLVDYIFNWLGHHFVEGFVNNGNQYIYDDENVKNTLKDNLKEMNVNQTSVIDKEKVELLKNEKFDRGEVGKACPVCGAIMEPKGGCKQVCPSCNNVNYDGCGG